MPKLTINIRTRGKAVAALLKLYKAESDFARELERLRIAYLPVLQQWLKIAVPGWVKTRRSLTRKEFSTIRDYFLTENVTISSSFADKVGPLLLTPDSQLACQLDTYVKALTTLADRWRLKASWAGPVLLLDHVQDMIINKIPKGTRYSDIPVEMLEPFLPSAPLPPLKFEMNPHELMFSGRQEIQDKFAKALAEYQ